MKFQYSGLGETGIDELHQTFLAAFSDYTIPMNPSTDQLKSMMKQRGVDLSLSAGCFINGKLAGFVLNSYRSWEGKPTFYNAGTGVIPGCRRKGIAENLLLYSAERAREKRAEQYLLEVITENRAACRLYKRFGFQSVRRLGIYQAENTAAASPAGNFPRFPETISMDQISLYVLPALGMDSFYDFSPSWQNSADSLSADPDVYYCMTASDPDGPAAVGIIHRMTGLIPVLAVHREKRRKGLGTAVLHELSRNTASSLLRFVNIDTSSVSFTGFLKKAGYVSTLEQDEMLLAIHSS